MWLFLIPFYAVGIGMIVWGLVPSVRAMKITPPEVDVSSGALRLGESFVFRYGQTVKAPLEVDFAKVTLVLKETAIYRRGTDTYTETNEIPVAHHEVPARSFGPGEELRLDYAFTIPPDGMHTFVASNNRIEWIVKVHVSIARWPDVTEQYPVPVLPERLGEDHPETNRVRFVEER